MAINAETIYITVDAKTSKAIKGLKTADKSSDKLFKSFKSLAGKAAIGAVVIGMVKLGKEFSKAASDAEEIGSKYATIFRDMSGEAESMADGFAESFGLAGSTARKLLGDTADLLTGFGLTQDAAAGVSLATNELASDVASFSNAQGGAEAVSRALTAAYSGERESLKTYGIVINDAMIKAQLLKQETEGLTFASEQQAKIAATLTLATQQSGNAIGDVQRTFNSHANVTRRLEQSTLSLKEALGESVNEGLTPLLVVSDQIVKSFANWVTENNKINQAVKDFKTGTADGKDSVTALNIELINQVSAMSALYDAQKINIAGSEAAIEAQKDRIKETKLQIALAAKKAASEALDAKFSAEAAKKKAEQDAADKKASEERAADLKNLNDAFAGTTQGQIEATESLIAYYNTFLQTPKVKAVLEDLNETLISLNDTEVENFREGWLTKEEITAIGVQAEIDLANLLYDTEKELYDKSKADMDEKEAAYISMGKTISGFAKGPLEELGAAMAKGEADWKDLQKAAVVSIANVVSALGDQAVIQAAIAYASGNIPTGIAYTAAATGAYIASGAIKASAESFPTGGTYTTDGPAIVGDNASGRERVTVEPLGGSEGGGNDTMILNIDGEQFIGYLQRQIDNRNIRIPRGSLV